MTTSTSTETDGHPAEEGNHEAANVDKIREILFGGQMRDYERQFTRMEEQFARLGEALREETKKRFDALEEYIHAEIDTLKQRLNTEKTDRASAFNDLERELRDSKKAHDERSAKIEDTMAEATGKLNARLLEQAKKLAEEIEEKHRALSSLLDQEVRALETGKTDRKALADLFTEFAMRLRDEFALPQGR
ncbi:MAG TPA: hypothetical protein VLZ81_10365 [Blastocatellia bacterium]|nr:hypothetical protein [Blastocatellia bacterium]